MYVCVCVCVCLCVCVCVCQTARRLRQQHISNTLATYSDELYMCVSNGTSPSHVCVKWHVACRPRRLLETEVPLRRTE
jgi:hypothetical protein